KSRGILLPDSNADIDMIHDMARYYPICEVLGIQQPKTFFYRLLEDYFDMAQHEIVALKSFTGLSEKTSGLLVLPAGVAKALARPSDGLAKLKERAAEAGFPEKGRYFIRTTISSFKYLKKEESIKKSPALQTLLKIGMFLKAADRENKLLEQVMEALEGIRGDEKLPELAVANSLEEAYRKIENIGLHLIAQGLVNENGFAIRECLDIKSFGRSDTVLPLNAEYRAVCYKGEVLSIDLWTPPHLFRSDVSFGDYALSQQEIKAIVDACKKFAKRTGARFFMMDWAKTTSGDLYLIEINPGYMTGLTHERSKVLLAYWLAKDLAGEKPTKKEYRKFFDAFASKEWFCTLNEAYLNYLAETYQKNPKLEEVIQKSRVYVDKRYAELKETRTVMSIF
ncbi:MAG: ATP-grasp domain-containing protein, partial [Desulfotomaculales bacterium]